jgi:hypothetical protein
MDLREAINYILVSINEMPLDDTDVIEDVSMAVIANAHLNNAKKSILAKGWYFNTTSMSLVPNTLGYIVIPSNFLSVDGGDAEPNLTVRDWKLFDKSEFIFKFDSNKDVEVIEDIPIDDIPFLTADYIVKMASLMAYTSIFGDANGISIRRYDVNDARIEAIREDANNYDGNLLEDDHSSTLLDKTSL